MICTGLCCQNTELTKKGIRCSRTCRQATFTIEKAKEIGTQNLSDCIKMMQWNSQNNIHSFRISSEILPHYTNPNLPYYDMEHFDSLFKEIGQLAIDTDQRITFHPDQFNVLSTNKQSVLDNTFRDLDYHAEMLERMGISPEKGVVNIHGGGVYDSKENAIRRWIDNFDSLPNRVKQYLTIENDEHNYDLEDCFQIATECKIPVVFDTHHEECYRLLHPETCSTTPVEELIEQVVDTFDKTNKEYLFHISSQRTDARVGAHSDYIDSIPSYLIDLADRKGKIYVDIEAKMKEKAIMDLRKRYSNVM